MKANPFNLKCLVVSAAMILGLTAVRAPACAVCFGDPDSNLVRGANAGILVLLFVIYGVLSGIIGVAGFWMFKARRRSNTDVDDATEPTDRTTPE